MEFHAVIRDGKMTLSPIQKESRERYLASMKDGARIKEKLTKESRRGTLKQGGAHFGLVVEMIRQRLIEMGIDVCGCPINKDMIHEILKRACGGVGDMGETMKFRDMSVEQRSKFFDNCRTWASTQLQLVIPDPDPRWREKETK